jgi:parallel beta-helix repeat protein
LTTSQTARAETLALQPTAGCGTLESPWTGWEAALERPCDGAHRAFLPAPGFYGVERPVRLADHVELASPAGRSDGPWFLPVAGRAPLETLFLVDGSRDVALGGLRLNGRGKGARHGVIVRGGSGFHLTGAHLEDFEDGAGAAVLVEGESAQHASRGIVVQSCWFLNGSVAVRLGRHASDLLVDDNRFEEITGPAIQADPRDEWIDYGLIVARNRMRNARSRRTAAFVVLAAGAEGVRLAENSCEVENAGNASGPAGFEIHGGGPVSRRRVELLLNRFVGIPGPGIRAQRCGPGFVAAGNQLVQCGAADAPAIDLRGSHRVLIEDNEIAEPGGPGIRLRDCARVRLNGNEIQGGSRGLPRGGSVGVLVEGGGSKRLRLTDNRIRCVKDDGLRIEWCAGARVVGNEVEDCGGGIRASRGTSLLLVGNDCRDNGNGGIVVADAVRRGFVALNYAILNGSSDLEVRGEAIRCRANKVDRGTFPREDAPGGARRGRTRPGGRPSNEG